MPLTILLVEDDPDDVFLVEHALARVAPGVKLEVCRDGEGAIAWLSEAGASTPAVVLLDLKLPRRDGFEVLAWIRADAACRDVPVIVHSSSQERRDIERAYELGANVYLAKQVDLRRLGELLRGIVAFAELVVGERV